MKKEPIGPSAAIEKSRMDFLFDGIFAIAMTILVLELKVPELSDRHSVSELAHALARSASTFVSYLLSFAMLGIFWHRHNQQSRHFRVITRGMFLLHLVQLAAAAFFPFCAALIGRYPINPLSVLVYMACAMSFLWASLGTWVVAGRSRAFHAGLAAADFLRTRKRMLRGCLVLSIFFAVALANILWG